MSSRVIYKDDYLILWIENNDVFIQTFKQGFTMAQLNSILAQHDEIILTSANTLRNSINNAPVKPQKFGELQKRIQLDIDPVGLTATIIFHLPEGNLSMSSREKLIREIYGLLNIKGVVYGINTNMFLANLKPDIPYVIAQGTPTIDGTDAVVKLYELSEVKPEINVNGRVDFYDLKLINKVKKGDWLGERIEATDGVPGKSVTGAEIKPIRGKSIALHYDSSSVYEERIGDKTILYSRLSGAVHYTDGRISVSNHLEIDGDVGVNTGNLKFDGYLTINGTVSDGYSVEATKDIEINGAYGLGNIKGLVSTGGSIYVKGGIATKVRVEIRAEKNVYVKFADNVQITCGGTAHIGYYSLNSNIFAKEVLFDASNGQVIGGHIKVAIHITVPIAGSEAERKTILEVSGFNRLDLTDRLNRILRQLSEKKIEQHKLKQQRAALKELGTYSSLKGSDGNIDRLFQIADEIKSLESERKSVLGYLKTKGDGEVTITRRIYPNCSIILDGKTAKIPAGTLSTAFYLKDGEIKVI